MNSPIICFGQQPWRFPKRFLVAKIRAAKALLRQIGGQIVFFYHDSDADYRETITLMRDRQTGADVRLNFTQENKVQKKFSPLYLKRIPDGWKTEILKQLPRFVDSVPPPSPAGVPHLSLGENGVAGGGIEGEGVVDIFRSIEAITVADFCLDMYQKMGLLDGIEVIRSSDKNFRVNAPNLTTDYFADIPYQNEIVRAQFLDNKFQLHEGGGKYTIIDAPQIVSKEQKTPGRDNRFGWMNSVINCTHYVTGNAEYDYLKRENFPNIKFVKREQIEESDYAWLGQ